MSARDNINAVLLPYGVIIDNEVRGTRVTQYSATLTSDAPVSKLMKLRDALSIALDNDSISIRRQGNQFIIEVPTGDGIVYFNNLVNQRFIDRSGMMIALGKSVDGQSLYTDLAKQPHILVAGTTGGGKSMFLHSVIASLLIKDPTTQITAIDGKGSEFIAYSKIPSFHYIKDTSMALAALERLCQEMDRRYAIFTENGWRDIDAAISNGRRINRQVCIIDELADLMLQDKATRKGIETCIVRLAQKARAAGIHLVIATQRPTRDVVTGLIKANIPCRVCFHVTSSLESRIVLDQNGAENLLDKGDMLFLGNGKFEPIRIQACYMSADDMKRIADKYTPAPQPQPQYTSQSARPTYRTYYSDPVRQPKQYIDIDTVVSDNGHFVNKEPFHNRFKNFFKRQVAD